MDTHDRLVAIVHMGFHRTVPPVLHGTVGQDGHTGYTSCSGTHGIPQDSPTCPTWNCGTGLTHVVHMGLHKIVPPVLPYHLEMSYIHVKITRHVCKCSRRNG